MLVTLGAVVGASATFAVLGGGTTSVEQRVQQVAATSSAENNEVVPSTSSQLLPANSDDQDPFEALRAFERPSEMRAAALALLESVGRDPDAIARVASAFPEANRMNFLFDAIASSAAQDPAGAIAHALSLDDLPSRSEAITRIARILGDRDPELALQHGLSIDNATLAAEFRHAVLEAWANNDVDGFLAFVREAPLADTRGALDAFAAAAASRPEAVLGILDELPQGVRMIAETAAVDYLLRADTDAALQYLESLPLGNARDQLFFSSARSFALHDMERALTWVNALEPPSLPANTGVVLVLAIKDSLLGAEQVLGNVQRSGSANATVDMFSVMRVLASGPPDLMANVANRFAGVDNAASATTLERFIDAWSLQDADAAFNWSMANTHQLSRDAIRSLARNVSTTQPELAMVAADRLPPDLRDLWIQTVATEIPRAGLDRALQWIGRYEGQPVYDQALSSMLEYISYSGAVENPNSLAQFLDRRSASVRAESVAVVANIWAEADPPASARWAERVELSEADEATRGAAFENIARRWAERDAAAAERWVRELAEGESRDRAIGAVLSASSNAGRVDTRLIESFSSDLSAQQQLVGTMCGLGANNADLGRELIDTYFTDPQLGAQAEERLMQGITRHLNCGGFGYITFR